MVAYTYLASGFIGMAITRFRHRDAPPLAGVDAHHAGADQRDSAVR